jgi:hypothetical protein
LRLSSKACGMYRPSEKAHRINRTGDTIGVLHFPLKRWWGRLFRSNVPIRSIVLAVVLSIGGGVLFALSLLSVWQTGQLFTDHHFVLLMLTFLMLVPGLYHVYLAANAFFGYPGFSYDDIPSFE